MRAKKQDTEFRQRQIASAALKLTGQKSFAEIGITDIAKEVGIVPSGIYRHYAGKDEILAAILDIVQIKLRGIVRVAREQSDGSLDQLHLLILAHSKLLSDNPGIPEIIFPQGIFGQHPSNRQKIQNIMREYLGEVVKIIENGQTTGQIRKDTRPQVIARLFFGLVLPGALMMSKGKRKSEIVRQVKEAWPLFEDSVKITG